MSETNVTTSAPASPPPAEQPARAEPDPAARLHELARVLARTQNRRLLMEYMRLRRAR